MEFEVKSLEQTKLLAQSFIDSVGNKGAFVSMYGDIGAGKTQFCRFALNHLGIDNVTSPSFVILNEYKTKKFPIYHFDLYRLEESGLKSIKEELQEYSKEGVLTFVEWANFGKEELPNETLDIKIKYDKDSCRTFIFSANTDYFNEIISKTKHFYEKAVK